MNILKKADQIINKRGPKEKAYGPFKECMQKAARIASEMSSKELTTVDMYNVIIAIKLSRQAHSHTEDNLLDTVAYLASLNDLNNGE